MKGLGIAGALAGLAVVAALVAYFGAAGVLQALFAIGLSGFLAICAIHLVLIVVMGVAWRALLPRSRSWAAIWGRLIRDSGAEVLPLSQVGGYVMGARAITLGGVSGTAAAASTIVDVTVEFLAQLAYTLLGLLWLLRLQPTTEVAVPVAIGLVVAGAAAAAFLVVQRRGFNLLDRMARALGQGWADKTADGAAALHGAIARIYRRRAGLWGSFSLHLFCWIASVSEAWLALRLAGAPLGFGPVLVIESLLYAARTAAFAVPNAVGVQEGAYVLLGASFGLTPDVALALSLIKRARDLAIGAPALGIWQAVEGGRVWRRFGAPRPPAGPRALTRR
jgi:glycosyltransferase 2 family protein